ncbi:transcription factor bHLH112 isoform X2 [Andrographis paniculata]|nr:transcription factor bHLH112 isoform X2 [Andrographis paniculata]
MADDEQFPLGTGNWWDHSSRNRFENNPGTSAPPPTSISTTLNAIASFGWPPEMVDMKSAGGGVLADPMMKLGLSSQTIDWNQTFMRGEKGDHGSFRCLLQEDMSSASSNFPAAAADSGAAAYGLLLPEQQAPSYQNRPPMAAYAAAELPPWSNKYPPSSFLRTSPPKQTPPAGGGGSHLHFTNNTPFWNASAMADGRSSFFPPLQNQIPSANSTFDDKLKNTSEMRESSSSTSKKNSGETSSKRPRNESPSPLPAFKVRKEKMGDRITALQQLVSPFGKTDTASVLSEAIEYIKFLHDQISVLSTPYMKNGCPPQHQ